jgi:hypothetical protein
MIIIDSVLAGEELPEKQELKYTHTYTHTHTQKNIKPDQSFMVTFSED